MRNSKILAAAVATHALLLSSFVARATNFDLASARCTGAFTLNSYELTCDGGSGGSTCVVGSSVKIEASLQFESDMQNSEVSLSAEACKGYCTTLLANQIIDLCAKSNSGAVTPTGGQECKEAGPYDVALSNPNFQLPFGEGQSSDWYFYITVKFEDGTAGTCDLVVSTGSSSSSSGYQYTAAGVAVIGLTGLLFVGRRRISHSREETMAEEGEGEVVGNFEMMKDPPPPLSDLPPPSNIAGSGGPGPGRIV